MANLRDERLQIMLSPDELKLVDDFRFQYRMPTRAAAVRELLHRGLASAGAAADGQKSANYGLFARGPTSHQDEEGSTD